LILALLSGHPDDGGDTFLRNVISVLTRATRDNIPEDGILRRHRRENLKSYIALTGLSLLQISNMFPVRYELGFYIPEYCIIPRISNRRVYREYVSISYVEGK
jgi:hypothetical protein